MVQCSQRVVSKSKHLIDAAFPLLTSRWSHLDFRVSAKSLGHVRSKSQIVPRCSKYSLSLPIQPQPSLSLLRRGPVAPSWPVENHHEGPHRVMVLFWFIAWVFHPLWLDMIGCTVEYWWILHAITRPCKPFNSFEQPAHSIHHGWSKEVMPRANLASQLWIGLTPLSTQ